MRRSVAPRTLVPKNGLILGPADAPLITVALLAEETPEAAPITLPPEAQAAIAGLLQVLPAATAASATSGAYLLRFAPQVSAQLATGQVALMQAVEGGARAIAVDAQGTIVAHGTLIPITGLSPALAASLWQVAAVATAQHYLVSMQRQLARVESAISALRDWMNDREIAGLITNARWLQDTLAACKVTPHGEHATQATLHIEQIAREAALVVEARRMTLARAAEQVRALPLADAAWWNVEHNVAALRGVIAEADHEVRVGAMGLAVWSVAAQARRTLCGPSARDQFERRRLSEARAQLGDTHRLVGEIAHTRAETITAPSDLRNALPNLQAIILAEVAASTEQRIADLAVVEQALVLLNDQTDEAQAAVPYQLVARCGPNGSWSLTHYQPPVVKEGLGSARITADVLNRLLRVPGLTLASLQDANSAKARFTLRNGLAITSWRNLAGFNHVFVRDSTNRIIFGGFVGWDNEPLEDAIREIWRCYS